MDCLTDLLHADPQAFCEAMLAVAPLLQALPEGAPSLSATRLPSASWTVTPALATKRFPSMAIVAPAALRATFRQHRGLLQLMAKWLPCSAILPASTILADSR
jgi:hypothetical protein